jgi:hypothetical protein
VVDREVHGAPRTAELVAEPLDRQPDGGGVDDRQHLLDVLGEQLVEQDLVAVAQVGQVHPLGQVPRLRGELGIGAAGLHLQRGHPGGQQPHQAQLPALLLGERGAAVDRRRGQHRVPAGVDASGHPVGGPDELVGSLGHDAPYFFFFGM